MSEQITAAQRLAKQPRRYSQANIIDHLASQYVLGTLTLKVRQRVETLSQCNPLFEQAINGWQQSFVGLDQQTEPLPPSEASWQQIIEQLGFNNIEAAQASPAVSQSEQLGSFFQKTFFQKIVTWLAMPPNRTLSVFSLVTLLLLSLLLINPMMTKPDPLSYVAVLTEQDGQAHLVASTYGESKKLVINVINSPKISIDQALELWVISKTDGQARSLGGIGLEQVLIEQQLSEAQWRLIKDSDALIVTIEESGGSAIGEPSEVIVSRGLCIKLKEWQKNA